ncbi:MAG: type I-E CRISPR-associated protein Cse2/CasB [Chloroflexi bacterium]|nr:type I-E CRISPR-associated protein Cse2/CasB [Chloroflexota bacterium]
MTMSPEASDLQTKSDRSWGGIAVRIAGRLARDDFPRGDLAALRRMSPNSGREAAAFWRLAARYELLGAPSIERKWALIIHGIALMTPTAAHDGAGLGAHDPGTSVGAALFGGNDESSRESGFYSELRLNRLLAARGDVLQVLLARMFRMLGASGVAFDWREMVRLILLDGFDQAGAEAARQRIARDYFRAEFRAERQAAGTANQ